MSFDVNWDIEQYRDSQERDDFWHLRRTFMEKWKQTYAEEKVVYLARAFANIALMGSTYPVEVMQQIAWMSKDLNINMNYKTENDNSMNSPESSDEFAALLKTMTEIHRESETVESQPLKATKNLSQEGDADFKVFIRDVNKLINPDEFNLIQSAILGGSSCYTELKFTSIWTESGYVGLSCANPNTKRWIEKEIRDIVPWPGARLVVANDSAKISQDLKEHLAVTDYVVKDVEVEIIENDLVLIDLTESENMEPNSDDLSKNSSTTSNKSTNPSAPKNTKALPNSSEASKVSSQNLPTLNSLNPTNIRLNTSNITLYDKKASKKLNKVLKKKRKEFRLINKLPYNSVTAKIPPKPTIPALLSMPYPGWIPPIDLGLENFQSEPPKTAEVKRTVLKLKEKTFSTPPLQITPPAIVHELNNGHGTSHVPFKPRNLCVAIMTNPLYDLTVKQATEIRTHLEVRIQEYLRYPSSVPLRFRGEPGFSQGVIKLWCEDENTLNWLIHEVGKLASPIFDSILVVRPCREIKKLVKCALIIPDIRDVNVIRAHLSAQNRFVDVDSWAITKVERQLLPPRTMLRLNIPWDDIVTLKLQNLRMYWLLGSVNIEITSGNCQTMV